MRLGHKIKSRNSLRKMALLCLFFLPLLQYGCVHSTPPPPELEAADAAIAPAWTYRKPENPQTLYGLARVPMGPSAEETRHVALEVAQQDLMVSVKSEVRRWCLQTGGETTRAQLEGLWDEVMWDLEEETFFESAKIQRYDDDTRGRVWLLAELERSSVHQALEATRAEAAPRGLELLKDGKAAEASGDLQGALKAYAKGLSALIGPVGLVIPGTSSDTLLRQELQAALLNALKPVRVVRVKGPESVRPGDTQALIVAEFGYDGGSLRLPMRFELLQGEGDVQEASGPDGKGRSQTYIENVAPDSDTLIIRAIPDLGRLGGGSVAERERLRKATANWDMPEARFSIEIIPVELLLSYIERGGTGGERGNLLMTELGDALTKAGAHPMDTDVQALITPEVFEQVQEGTRRIDTTGLEGVELIGVARITLSRREVQEQTPPIHKASGTGSFYLYDVMAQRMVIEVETGPMLFTGFSQIDAERGFFLQTSDRLRDLVILTLADEPLLAN